MNMTLTLACVGDDIQGETMAIGCLLKVDDKTTCGGIILTGNSTFNIEGKPAATEGSKVSCGKVSGTFQIIGGVDFMITSSGKSAGMLDSVSSCPCGSSFIASSHKKQYESNLQPKIQFFL